MKGKRILKSENILQTLLATNDSFFIGIPFEDAIVKPDFSTFGFSKNFVEGLKVMPNPKANYSKQNLKGKMIRKSPESKITRRVHIAYDRRTDGVHIEYDRDFNVYAKILQHKYEIKFTQVTNKHEQKLLVSPLLVFDNSPETNLKNTHCINLFLEIFGEYEIYTSELEPALGFTTKYSFEILPKGTIEDEDIQYILEGARRYVKEPEIKAFQKRLQIIKEHNPEIVGKGPNGFFGYIVFGFKELGVVLLESMYLGNATYIFDIANFEKLIVKNKQDVLNNKLAKQRFFHYDNWEFNIRKLLSENNPKAA